MPGYDAAQCILIEPELRTAAVARQSGSENNPVVGTLTGKDATPQRQSRKVWILAVRASCCLCVRSRHTPRLQCPRAALAAALGRLAGRWGWKGRRGGPVRLRWGLKTVTSFNLHQNWRNLRRTLARMAALASTSSRRR